MRRPAVVAGIPIQVGGAGGGVAEVAPALEEKLQARDVGHAANAACTLLRIWLLLTPAGLVSASIT